MPHSIAVRGYRPLNGEGLSQPPSLLKMQGLGGLRRSGTWAYDERERVEQGRGWAAECGFELAGIPRAAPRPDARRYLDSAELAMAGAMGCLTDRRALLRTG